MRFVKIGAVGLILAGLLVQVLGLAGCSTVEGIGKDIQNTARWAGGEAPTKN